MRFLQFCLFISLLVYSFSCHQDSPSKEDEDKDKELVVLDSILFQWYAPGAWNFYAFQVGPKLKSVLENDQIKSFKLADENRVVYSFLKKDKDQELDFKEWQFQCWNILDVTHCFYTSGSGIYPKIPEDETSDLRFTLYLVE